MSDLPTYRIKVILQGRLNDGSDYKDVGFADFDFTDPELFRVAHDTAYDAARYYEQKDKEKERKDE